MNSLTLLLIGDIHAQSNNVNGVCKMADEIISYIESDGPFDVIVSLGDEFENHNPPADVRGLCVDFFRVLQSKCQKFISLVGNHTRKNNYVSTGPDHTLADLDPENGSFVETPRIFQVNGISFCALPYINPPDFNAVLEPVFSQLPKCAFVLAHQEIHGSTLRPGHLSECDAAWPDTMPPMISGHIHQRHWFRNVFYTGTPMQHTFAESRDKYIYKAVVTTKHDGPQHWTVSESTYTCKHIRLTEHRMITTPIRTQESVDISELDLVAARVAKAEDDYWKITVTYDDPEILRSHPSYMELKRNRNVKLITERNTRVQQSMPKATTGTIQFKQFIKDFMRNNSLENDVCAVINDIL